MPTLYPAKRIALNILGKLTLCPPWGSLPCGTYVFQRVQAGLGNVPWDNSRTLQLRVHVPHNPSNTPDQQRVRNNFAAAIWSWQLLSPEEKNQWRQRGRRLRLSGYNEYIRDFLRGRLFV